MGPMAGWVAPVDPATFRRLVVVSPHSAQLNTADEKFGVPVMPPETQPNGAVTVTHGTQVFAFTQDGLAQVFYLAGTTPQDYATDLTALDRAFAGYH